MFITRSSVTQLQIAMGPNKIVIMNQIVEIKYKETKQAELYATRQSQTYNMLMTKISV